MLLLLLFASVLFLLPPPLLLALSRTSPPMFSANLRQTVLIQLVQSSSAEENRTQRAAISQLGKRATTAEASGGRRNNRKIHTHHQCERLSERQKYARLELAGGRNQQFMANSPREASRNFPSLLPQALDEEPPEMFLRQNDDPREQDFHEQMAIMGSQCDQRCREIKAKLEHALGDSADWDWTERLDDAQLDEGLAGPEGIGTASSMALGRRGGCRLERFVPIGNCTEHGFEEAQGSEKLCTACQGIFLLNRNCFPLFVNSVVCGRNELECIYDRMSGSAQGKCRPKMLSFKVMFNRGTAECERWAFEHLEVPVACECYLSKRSVWLEAVPPPGAVAVSEEH